MPPEHDKLVQYYMRKWIVIILFLFLMDVRINFAPLCLVSEICSLFHLTCKGNVCVCVYALRSVSLPVQFRVHSHFILLQQSYPFVAI